MYFLFRDLPFEAQEFLQILISLKAKITIDEVPLTKSIKDISGGKSTLQNEILADLQKEFGDNIPERAEEISLKDLGAHLQPKFTGLPGKYSSDLLSRLFGGKMSAGFTIRSAKDLLDKEFGLASKASNQILLFRLVSVLYFTYV